MMQNRHDVFYISYVKDFGVLTEVGVEVIIFIRAEVFKPETRAESELKNVTLLITGWNSIWIQVFRVRAESESHFQTPTSFLFQNI